MITTDMPCLKSAAARNRNKKEGEKKKKMRVVKTLADATSEIGYRLDGQDYKVFFSHSLPLSARYLCVPFLSFMSL
jgi:hypothetical protein